MEYKYNSKTGFPQKRHSLYFSQGTTGLGTSLLLEDEKKKIPWIFTTMNWITMLNFFLQYMSKQHFNRVPIYFIFKDSVINEPSPEKSHKIVLSVSTSFSCLTVVSMLLCSQIVNKAWLLLLQDHIFLRWWNKMRFKHSHITSDLQKWANTKVFKNDAVPLARRIYPFPLGGTV